MFSSFITFIKSLFQEPTEWQCDRCGKIGEKEDFVLNDEVGQVLCKKCDYFADGHPAFDHYDDSHKPLHVKNVRLVLSGSPVQWEADSIDGTLKYYFSYRGHRLTVCSKDRKFVLSNEVLANRKRLFRVNNENYEENEEGYDSITWSTVKGLIDVVEHD